MIAIARSAHPHLTFDVALMTELPVDHGSLAAVVLWYSIIHTPPARLRDVWNELARVLAPNGRMLLGFQAGDNEEVKRENDHGSSTTMTWYRHNSDDVVLSVEQSGFAVHTRIWRVAELAHETTPQVFLTFQRQT
jgi:ubiquinone/menaquinone biosynthesis C-methylase UbiE